MTVKMVKVIKYDNKLKNDKIDHKIKRMRRCE